jgi:phosphoribosylaminoimidazole carboxylase PurE protein
MMAAENNNPVVGILMGSDSDLPVMEGTAEVLEKAGVACELRVLSAHRVPEETAEYAKTARERGIKVLVAGAGGAAHLAGVLAAHSTLPVIGVPLDATPLQGMDACLATLQMPPGVPVATVSIGKWGAKNAGILALQILATADTGVADYLKTMKQEMKKTVLKKDQAVQGKR